ncbi:hypothetical protein PHISCL_04157 [Aspergillus sclerotialis]|uniref:Uncharacterized protein n=1 Tax=Aspergillus sclerotialis TaxID=2070753 RepID=A0A3A2ZJX9_9EURO|nr:hypothetical protein PHISCL_04157 [Aspergillus sclerotialis]
MGFDFPGLGESSLTFVKIFASIGRHKNYAVLGQTAADRRQLDTVAGQVDAIRLSLGSVEDRSILSLARFDKNDVNGGFF